MIAILEPIDILIYIIACGCFVACIWLAVRIILDMVRHYRAMRSEPPQRVRPYQAIRRPR